MILCVHFTILISNYIMGWCLNLGSEGKQIYEGQKVPLERVGTCGQSLSEEAQEEANGILQGLGGPSVMVR